MAKAKSENTPIIIAILSGETGQALELIESGSNVNSPGAGGITPLMYACSPPLLQLIVRLIEKGADVNAQDDNGRSAIFGAINSHDREAVNYLITKGAKLDQFSKAGYTPLMTAVAAGDFQIVELLVKSGANINQKIKRPVSKEEIAMMKMALKHLESKEAGVSISPCKLLNY
jgi:ankyrin